MNSQTIYILIGIVVLIILALLLLVLGKQKKEKPFTMLVSLAFAFVLAGTLFGEERWLGYGLMGIGVVLAVIDIIRKAKKPS